MSREDYPLDECLELTRKNGIIDAMSYIYERLGSKKEALDLLVDIIRKRLDTYQIQLKKGDRIARYDFNEMDREFNAALSLCIRNSGQLDEAENEELWFCLLDQTLHGHSQFSPFFNKQIDLEVFINGVIKRVIEAMMDTVDFNAMIAHIA